jgi:hypothetical protein
MCIFLSSPVDKTWSQVLNIVLVLLSKTVHWLKLAHSNRPNRVGAPIILPDDNFWNSRFLEHQTMNKIQTLSELYLHALYDYDLFHILWPSD